MARAGLDRHRIVTAALDLVDEVGLDSLSTRALATRLGVQSPALYWHFRNKEELVAAMAEAMIVELPDAESASELTGRRVSRPVLAAWLVTRAEQFRRVLMSRRDGARIHAGSRPPIQRLAGVETQLLALERVGFDPAAAARVVLGISRFVLGWVLEEQSVVPGQHLPELSAHPALTVAMSAVDGADPDSEFSMCLNAVVSGLLRQR